MKMKRILIAGLALLMLCVLSVVLMTACNNGKDDPAGGTETDTEAAPATTPDEATEPETAAPATEPDTEPETEPETETEEETYKVALYQLAPEDQSLTMCYVIRTTHNKLIVIDGGEDGVGKDKAPYLPAALRAIAGVGDNDYFEVEAWFLTHAHKDHMNEISKMMRDYTPESNYKINNIYFDFPPFGTSEFTGTSDDMQIARLRENMNAYGAVIGAEVAEGKDYYDTINGAVVNEEAIKNGLEFNIDGVRIEVLQTWSIKDGYSNLNDQSMITRFWVDGQSILFLGDCGPIAGKRLQDTYGEALKSDIVQMAHHGQAGVNKACYAAIDAQIHLWPTPVWVWKNESKTYGTDTTREWLYGETFLEPDEYNIVAGMYKKYPGRIDRVAQWTKVLPEMTIELPYILPYREGNLNVDPGAPTPGFTPVETPYVQDGLAHCYSGTMNTRKGHDSNAAVWEDLAGGYDVKIKVTEKTHFVDDGLYVNNETTYFPVKVVQVLEGKEFTVEMLLGELNSTGTLYNDILSSGNEHINLFRRNSENVLELKSLNNGRIKVPDALNIMQNALITITYKQGEFARIYVNGELKGELKAATGSLEIGDLYIGHNAADSCCETVFRSFRVYNRALTDEECAFNAAADGVA
ncbi:MAG: hypothetical protein MJ192_11210 [Clostridia bacterium]|nr:hypothetical protein [Clostridia bacterium]